MINLNFQWEMGDHLGDGHLGMSVGGYPHWVSGWEDPTTVGGTNPMAGGTWVIQKGEHKRLSLCFLTIDASSPHLSSVTFTP